MPVRSNHTGEDRPIYADSLFLSDVCKEGHGREQGRGPVYRAVSHATSVQTTLFLFLVPLFLTHGLFMR